MDTMSINCTECGYPCQISAGMGRFFCTNCGAVNLINSQKREPEDPLLRKEFYRQAVLNSEGSDPAKDILNLWPARYKPLDKKNTKFGDSFLNLWILLVMHGQNSRTPGGIKKARKDVERFFNQKDLIEALGKTTDPDRAIYNELLHSARLYLRTCQNDRQFGSTLFSLIKLKDKDVAEKAAIFMVRCVMEYAYYLNLPKYYDKIINSAYHAYKMEYQNFSDLIDKKISELEPFLQEKIKEIISVE